VCDVSTLGKIEIEGADAAVFLDRLYTNTFSTLPVGKSRYGLMLREDGFVMDDGTTSRLAPERYFMTTTTAQAGRVMQHLEFCHQVLWPELDVQMVSVSEQWAQFSIAGPRSRDLLRKLVDDKHDLGDKAFPYLAAKEMTVAGGIGARLFRLSFSGEMAYEVYCGAGHGTHVWKALVEAGKPFDMVAYGLEALGTLRIEKGHVTGAEIEGRTTARDLHLDWMLSKKKPFVGSMTMDREGLILPDRPALVGLIALDNRALAGGSHVVEQVDEANPRGSIGHVTAACYSPALGCYIALAMVKGGKARHGTRAFVSDPLRGRFGPVEIVSHHFYDPQGRRMHG
jgi:methylglutamate dehydrogenase subunit C